MALPTLDLVSLRAAYKSGDWTPSKLLAELYPKLEATGCAFIHLVSKDAILQRCAELEAQAGNERGSLWGVPLAVKDNVDVAGMPTTASCPAFQYVADASAPAVQALLDAGCICVGKTNLDQFASGLVGVRSPYGVPTNSFDWRFIPGGSSSGSAVLVGAGLVSLAIGTDTAGSGRVPAMFNGCVGVKPTVGSVSTVGVVPACASLDCLSMFAHNVGDGAEAMRVMRSASAGEKDRRRRQAISPSLPPADSFTFAVPAAEFLDWSGPGGPEWVSQSQALFATAIQRLQSAGGRLVPIDFGPCAAVARMLYEGGFVAERYSGIREFLDQRESTAKAQGQLQFQKSLVEDERLMPVIRHIIAGSGKFTAVDLFDDFSKLADLKAAAAAQLAGVHVLLVPTALHHYTVAEVQGQEGQDPPTWGYNANLGKFTNFVNLMDMCGLSVPLGLVRCSMEDVDEKTAAPEVLARKQHLAATGPTSVTLPFGVTLLGPAFYDDFLWTLGDKLGKMAGLGCGPNGHNVKPVVKDA